MAAMTALLELPWMGLSLRPGQALRAPLEAWAALAEPSEPVLYKGIDATRWTPLERRRRGWLVLFQRPQVPPGVTLGALLRAAGASRKAAREAAAALELRLDDASWEASGGRAEWAQAAALRPELIASIAPLDALSRRVLDGLLARGAAALLAEGS